MKEFKGTNGPWEFDKSSGKVRSETLDCVVDVCSSSVSPCDLELDDHNGFLIAAAPDLLEALQKIIEDLRMRAVMMGDVDEEGSVALDVSHSILMRAHAAIARALGESK